MLIAHLAAALMLVLQAALRLGQPQLPAAQVAWLQPLGPFAWLLPQKPQVRQAAWRSLSAAQMPSGPALSLAAHLQLLVGIDRAETAVMLALLLQSLSG